MVFAVIANPNHSLGSPLVALVCVSLPSLLGFVFVAVLSHVLHVMFIDCGPKKKPPSSSKILFNVCIRNWIGVCGINVCCVALRNHDISVIIQAFRHEETRGCYRKATGNPICSYAAVILCLNRSMS